MRRELFSTFLIICFSGATLFAQSDECTPLPVDLPVNGTCTTQTFTNNENGTSPEFNSSCAGGYGTAYEDVWYSLTGTGNTVSVTASGGNRDMILSILTSCAAGEIACIQIDAGFAGTINFATVFGTTYYVQIQRRSGTNNNNLNGDICAVDPLLGGGGSNDDPCVATPLSVNATCTFTTSTNVGATATGGVPAPGCANYSGGDVWFTLTVPASGNVNIETNSVFGGITDAGMAVYSGICSSLTLVECDDDDGPGLMPQISLTGQVPGTTLWVRVWEYGNDSFGEFDICATEPAPPGTNTVCTLPDPICSGSPILFTAESNGTSAQVVNPGNNYGCLSTTPNPTWFYLEIATPGDIAIDITAGSDIDFAIWGPYPNLAAGIADCNSYPLPQDCSYSISATEQANVAGVAASEVYILLVTNFASVVQSISLTEAPGMTATTNCAIVLGVDFAQLSGKRIAEGVQLSWLTTSELNNDYFAVERSTDGIVWTAFDVVNGAGTTSELQSYSSIDRNAGTGINYYRVKQFDFNGKIQFSDVITVSNDVNVTLFPNPADNLVQVASSDFFNTITISDLRGNVVYTSDFAHIKQTVIQTKEFIQGVYLVTVNTDSGQTIERLIVQ